MKKSQRRQYPRILAAVDPDAEDRACDALNVLTMDLATSLSAADNYDLWYWVYWVGTELTSTKVGTLR